MRLLALAAALAATATIAPAGIGPAFLPDLNFPAPEPAPTVSTQGCASAPAPCTN